eukprot:SM000001S04652  [mRNA]  locus=s1:1502466:1505823:+ [translate_table: standard]
MEVDVAASNIDGGKGGTGNGSGHVLQRASGNRGPIAETEVDALVQSCDASEAGQAAVEAALVAAGAATAAAEVADANAEVAQPEVSKGAEGATAAEADGVVEVAAASSNEVNGGVQGAVSGEADGTAREAGDGVKAAGNSCKLFVGQLPRAMTGEAVRELFSVAGDVTDVAIIRDRVTQKPRGCCFVTFSMPENAARAIELLHAKRTLPPLTRPLQVKYANTRATPGPHPAREDHLHISRGQQRRLYLSNLPDVTGQDKLQELLAQYGAVKDLVIKKSQKAGHRTFALVSYSTEEEAQAAIDGLNSKHVFEASVYLGAVKPMLVRHATEERARRLDEGRGLGSSPVAKQRPGYDGSGGWRPQFRPLGTHHPSQFWALESKTSWMGNRAGLSLTSHVLPVIATFLHQNNSMLPSASYPSVVQALTLEGGPLPAAWVVEHLPDGTPVFFPVHTAAINPPAFPQFPLAPLGPAPFVYGAPKGAYAGPPPFLAPNEFMPEPPSSDGYAAQRPPAAPHVEGPEGANLYVAHIPAEFGNEELKTAFGAFGKVLSTEVLVDRGTGESRCCGFVSFDAAGPAKAAISVMDGFELNGKKLKVALKQEHEPKVVVAMAH